MGPQQPISDAAHVRRHLLVDAALKSGLRPVAPVLVFGEADR